MESLPLLQHFSAASIIGLVGIAAVANLFPGLPEEIPLLGIGVAIGSGIVSFPVALTVTWITLLVIDNLMYYMARRGSRIVMFFQKKIFNDSIDVKSEFIQTHLDKIVFFSRFMVHLRFLGIFIAGVNRMPWKRFIMVEAPALALYLAILLGLGSYFHGRFERLLDGVGVTKNILTIIIIAAVILFAVRFIYVRMMRHLRGEQESKIFTVLGFSRKK